MEKIIHYLTTLPPLLQFGVVILTILGLWGGSEKVIWGVKNIARRFGIPEILIGLSIVSIGSSFPEIFVNISAALQGADDIGVGNVVGSCFVQISFILGICVLVGGAMKEHKRSILRDGGMLLGSILLLFIFGLDGEIGVGNAIILISLYVGYLAFLFRTAHEKSKTKKRKKSKVNISLCTLAFISGTALVWVSAEVLIGIGISAGEKMGLDKSIIGLLSGIGTSIPELSISLMALLRKSNGISVGNLLGSNITDPLLSLSIGAIIAGGYSVSSFLLFTAIPTWFMASSSVIAIFWFWGRLSRVPAAALVGFYCISFFFFMH